MRAWKIHCCWALIALVSAGAWGRRTASVRATVLRERESVAVAPAAPVTERPAPSEAPSPSSPTPISDLPPLRLPPGFRLLPDPNALPVEDIRQLMKSNDHQDVYKGMCAVYRIKDPALQRELYLGFLTCPFDQFRYNALLDLEKLLQGDVLPIAQERLRVETSDWVRAGAAEILGRFPDQGSVDLLLNAYRDGSPELKIAAAASLYKLGRPGEADRTLSGLVAGLEDPDGSKRRDTVEQIGRMNLPIAVAPLARALRDSNGDVRSEAALALGRIKAPGIVPLLEPLLQDPFADVRDSAQTAIDQQKRREQK